MSPSEHTRVFRRLIRDAFNDGRLAILDELLTADFVDHSPCRQLGGAEALRSRIALLRVAMPDLEVRIDDVAAAGDMTWAAVTVCGSGLRFSQADTCRFVDGRIAEFWSESADVMAQMGIDAG
jgi:predicted SnoaL-like aldol condensation-catalyzing enzyme